MLCLKLSDGERVKSLICLHVNSQGKCRREKHLRNLTAYTRLNQQSTSLICLHLHPHHTMTQANILDSSSLLTSLPKLLPGPKTLNHPQDALTALTHAVFSVLGFRLVGVDESSSGTFPDNILPDIWNSQGPGSYTLRYRHEQSSLEFTIKVTKLGSRTLVNGIASEASYWTRYFPIQSIDLRYA